MSYGVIEYGQHWFRFSIKPLPEPVMTLETNFSDIGIDVQNYPFNKMQLKILFITWRPVCLGLNVSSFYYDTVECHYTVVQYNNIAHIIARTEAEYQSEAEFTA